jgi:hypothetical protein
MSAMAMNGADAAIEQRRIPLDGGFLEVRVDRADWPLDRLCGFASRNNPRRRFLIVSKVLGRHLPARPAEMRAAMNALAARIGELPEPILVLGLAETAICLGQGIHQALAREGREAGYIHSTRQQLDLPLLCRFDEPHSHAASHIIYRPDSATIDTGAIRSLLLVDDEVSTGTTLVNLAGALAPHLPACERIAVATLTDWSGSTAWLERMPKPAACSSLLSGRLEWSDGPVQAPEAPAALPTGSHDLGTLPSSARFGRAGIGGERAIPLPSLDQLGISPRQRLRVVGTGEFTYPPFLLAERLEQAGHEVLVQATSRSPVRLGGAITGAIRFGDNYGAPVPNFLYNLPQEDIGLTLVCYETPPGSLDPQLLDRLDGRAVHFAGS